MEATLRTVQTLRMARGEVGRIRARRGAVVRVLRGRVWLTDYGGVQDWVLRCGASHALTRGVAVVESTAPAVVEVLAPASRLRLAAERLMRALERLAAPFRTGNPA
jgi:hypothetical protein